MYTCSPMLCCAVLSSVWITAGLMAAISGCDGLMAAHWALLQPRCCYCTWQLGHGQINQLCTADFGCLCRIQQWVWISCVDRDGHLCFLAPLLVLLVSKLSQAASKEEQGMRGVWWESHGASGWTDLGNDHSSWGQKDPPVVEANELINLII